MSTLDFKIMGAMPELSKDHRLNVLMVLILRANKRNRCWPGMRYIAKNACPGKTSESAGNIGMATRAKKWLIEHGAIVLVRPEDRIGAEKKLARNRHIYQLTGVVVIDKKTYPYLYIPGNEYVSGDETIGGEDVSGDEISGGEVSGDEISGGETNHLSVVSSISSNQKSGANHSSSSKGADDDDDFDLTDKERSMVFEAFGSLSRHAKACLKKDREKTIGFSEYALATRLCFDKCDKRYVHTPPQYIFKCVSNGDPVPELPQESDEKRLARRLANQKKEQQEERSRFTDAEWAEKEKQNEIEWEAHMAELAAEKEKRRMSSEKIMKAQQRHDACCELREYMASQEKNRVEKIRLEQSEAKAIEQAMARKAKEEAERAEVLRMIEARRAAAQIENIESVGISQ